jgi:hypothetical protein
MGGCEREFGGVLGSVSQAGVAADTLHSCVLLYYCRLVAAAVSGPLLADLLHVSTCECVVQHLTQVPQHNCRSTAQHDTAHNHNITHVHGAGDRATQQAAAAALCTIFKWPNTL